MNSIRNEVHKTRFTKTELTRAQKVATALRMKLAPFIRGLLDEACDHYDVTLAAQVAPRQTHRIGMLDKSEGPRCGPFEIRHRKILMLSAKVVGGSPDPHKRI